jgi:hypothetical protein
MDQHKNVQILHYALQIHCIYVAEVHICKERQILPKNEELVMTIFVKSYLVHGWSCFVETTEQKFWSIFSILGHG